MADEEKMRAADSGEAVVGNVIGSDRSLMSRLMGALTDDGYLAAAGRQGLGELGEALKAFPDSIQVQEPGTIFNPTQGEIASDRADVMGRALWPSELAETSQIVPPQIGNGKDYGNDNGYDNGYSM